MDSLKTNIAFFQNLGKLYYAIASCDKRIMEEELHELKKIIHTNWVFHNSEEPFENFTAFQIEHIFMQLKDAKSNPDICFQEFLKFKVENEILFTDVIKQTVWKTVNEIAAVFAGKNKSELILLAKLKLNFIK